MFVAPIADLNFVIHAMCEECQEWLKMPFSALFIHFWILEFGYMPLSCCISIRGIPFRLNSLWRNIFLFLYVNIWQSCRKRKQERERVRKRKRCCFVYCHLLSLSWLPFDISSSMLHYTPLCPSVGWSVIITVISTCYTLFDVFCDGTEVIENFGLKVTLEWLTQQKVFSTIRVLKKGIDTHFYAFMNILGLYCCIFALYN